MKKIARSSDQTFLFLIVLLCLSPFTLFGSDPALLLDYDENAIRAVINNEVPDFSLHTVTLINSGWDNLVADVNNEWIFRFPRTEKFLQILKRENVLLKRLQCKVSVQIPLYKFIGIRTVFVGYPKIKGSALNEKIYLECSIEIRQEIADTLGLFLTQFHHALSIKEALDLGYEKYNLPLQSIEHNLSGTFHILVLFILMKSNV